MVPSTSISLLFTKLSSYEILFEHISELTVLRENESELSPSLGLSQNASESQRYISVEMYLLLFELT